MIKLRCVLVFIDNKVIFIAFVNRIGYNINEIFLEKLTFVKITVYD